MIRTFIRSILYFIVWLSIIGCGQLSSLQTGRVLNKGEKLIGGGIHLYNLDRRRNPDLVFTDRPLPLFELTSRFGLGRRFDLGLKLSIGYNLLVDAKYQIIGNDTSPFALALGTGLEYQFTTRIREVIVFRTHVPIYISYHVKNKAAFYFTPRFVHQFQNTDPNVDFIGGSFGMKYQFNKRVAGLVEGSYYFPQFRNDNGNSTNIYMLGFGYIYTFYPRTKKPK